MEKDGQSPVVHEFFQLFKTPWEFYRKEEAYDVLVVTGEEALPPSIPIIFLFGCEKLRFDESSGVSVQTSNERIMADHSGSMFPIKKRYCFFSGCRNPVVRSEDGEKIIAYSQRSGKSHVIRIGFDLFEEVGHLLQEGQDVADALIPALEIMIDLLRRQILTAGLGLVEVPPVPYGFNFTVCLTHDVDFLRIQDHFFDHTFFGFLLRSFFPWAFPGYRNRMTVGRYLKNVLTVLMLPLVPMRLVKDPWLNIGKYIRLERSKPSSFFFIPWGKVEGVKQEDGSRRNHFKRRAKYNLEETVKEVAVLAKNGKEIGLHGIDAWVSMTRGEAERKKIQEIFHERDIGVRMHWLYLDGSSPRILEKAGFNYDSTVGYNETVGFRAGTSQIYGFPGTNSFLELPMIIMDASLFYPKRMGLSENQAFSLCREVIGKVEDCGGVLTINWHQRSLSPERNWDRFYVNLLEMLEKKNVWFAKGRQAVQWYRMRRGIRFGTVQGEEGLLRLSPGFRDNTENGEMPGFMVRKYPRGVPVDAGNRKGKGTFPHVDIEWVCKSDLEISPDL